MTEVYYPEEISTGYYLTSIAEGLAENFDVKVLCGQPKHMSRGMRAPKREVRNGVEIFRAAATTLDKNVMLYRLFNMFTIGVAMFYNSLKRFRKGDQILVVTAPPTMPVTTAFASLLRGASYTVLVQDSYPEILIAVGALRKNSLAVSTINFFNRWVYKYAAKIIVMGRDMKELFERKTAGLDIPIVTIPNWADLETIHPTPRESNQLLKDLGISDKFVLLYAGNIGHPTDVETIISSAEQLRDHQEIHFLFIGAGVKKKWVEDQVRDRSLTNVSVLNYLPRGQQIVFLNACDVGLIALINGMLGTAMPSRTYNIMAAGKPILALTEQGSELAQVIDEEGIGKYVDPGKTHDLTNAILQIFEDRDKLGEMGERAHKAAVAKYSLLDAVAKYRNELV
ncbi:MAG: glycosyltransferase family 4 protein [Chloracidobacterium sp.]|nr:glycosyltransferase family 4 protein [Chloracidobacterium sp.]